MVTVRENYKEWAKNCYSEDFDTVLSPLTKSATKNRCCLCGQQTKLIAHHAFYTLHGAKDRPGYNLFPVCAGHHKEAHSPKNWVFSSDDPVTGRSNTPAFIQRLRQGFKFYGVEYNSTEKILRMCHAFTTSPEYVTPKKPLVKKHKRKNVFDYSIIMIPLLSIITLSLLVLLLIF